MRNIIDLITKYHFVIFFIIIESVALFLMIQFNAYPRTIVYGQIQAFNGFVNERIFTINDYLSLRQINHKLAEENLLLKNKLTSHEASSDSVPFSPTEEDPKFSYLLARVVSNSVNKQHNLITINRGIKDGVKEEMAVVSSDGVVGIVLNVSQQYATVIPILNQRLRLSGKIKANNYHGSVSWPGINYRKVSLQEIPHHVDVRKGQIVVTSGFSHYFPEGIPIGTISSYDLSEGNFYNIEVELSTDFKRLSYLYVVKNNHREEITELETNPL